MLPAAVGVRRPLALLAGVVEVEHRGHGVHPQPVDVVLLQPVQRVGDQEVAHLGAAVVEDQRAPVRVLAAARIGVLVQRPAVEADQRPLVLGEVRGHPVDDHADPRLVQAVDEEPEVVRVAEPGGRRVVGGDLVPPGAAEGVLGDRQELDVGEPQGADVADQLVGQLAVAQPLPPGAEVHLVDAHRLVVQVLGGPRGDPLLVAPDVVRLHHHRRRRGRDLGAVGHRVGLLPPRSVPAEDLQLVPGAGADPGDEQLPDPAGPQAAHRVPAPDPVVEVRDHPDRQGVRRPDRERRPLDLPHRAGEAPHVRPEHVPQLLVAALGDQVQVDLAEGGQEAVRVVHDRGVDRVVADPQPVVGHLRHRHHAAPDAVPLVLQGVAAPVLEDHLDTGRQRPQGPHGDRPLVRVGAQDGVRVVVAARGDGVQECRIHRGGAGG